jgi:hypothetical protein
MIQAAKGHLDFYKRFKTLYGDWCSILCNGANKCIHSDSKKRRSFVALLFAAGDVVVLDFYEDYI